MALSTSVVDTWHEGDRQINLVTITLDSSYADDGEALTYSDLGFDQSVDAVAPLGPARSTDGANAVLVSYDHTNSKLIAYWGNAGTASVLPEVTATTNLSTYSVRCLCWGQ